MSELLELVLLEWWISIAGSSWAVMALALTNGRAHTSGRASTLHAQARLKPRAA